MTNDTIPPTPTYNFDKLQVNNINWRAQIGTVFNSNMDKIETAISTGGGTTNYNALSNRPQINSITLTGNLGPAQLGLLGLNDTQTVTNKTIDAESNTISNISGTNFKTQPVADQGKIWGIAADGKTVLLTVNLNNYFLKTGGDLTGSIVNKTGTSTAIIKRENGESETIVCGGTDIAGTNGAYVILSGESGIRNGGFELGTVGGKKLEGKTNESLTWCSKDIATTDNTITLTNKTISAESNTISNITGSNFKTQQTTDAGKLWGISNTGTTTLIQPNTTKYIHYINMSGTNALDDVYNMTFTIVSNSGVALNDSTLSDYLTDNGLTGESVDSYFVPANGMKYVSGSTTVTSILGISAPDALTFNCLTITSGVKSVEGNIIISNVSDKVVAF